MYQISDSAKHNVNAIASDFYGLSTSLEIMTADVESALADIDARISGISLDLQSNLEFQELVRRVESLEQLENRIVNLEERLNMMDYYSEAL